MSAKSRTYEAKSAIKSRAATKTIKTVSLQVAITESDLASAVQRAFAVAKSSGGELNLAFCFQPDAPLGPGQAAGL